MNNKIFLKIGWLFILGLLAYLFFVVFFLSPKINNYLSENEINNSKVQFSKIVSIINSKSRTIEENDKLLNEVKLLLSSTTLGQTGYIYIFDSKGKIVFDPSGEFENQEFPIMPLPSANNNLLFEELKNAYSKRSVFEYGWNKVYDPYNYTYQKISWIEYNQKLDWYIVSSVYKDDFSSFIEGINSLILNISMLLFGVLAVIGIFIAIKVIVPINKMFSEVQKVSSTKNEFENGVKSKDEIGFLASQFNTLLDQVENNRKTLDEHVQ